MISWLALYMCCATHTMTSMPLTYHTLSNPAFTAYYGNFHVYIEPRDVGDISVFSCSGRFKNWGLGFSNLRAGDRYWNERRNWASIAHHVGNVPLSIGMNTGIYKIYDQTNFLADLGIWLKRPFGAGLLFSNVFHDDRILRGGISYTWRFLTAAFEVEDTLRSGTYVLHGAVVFRTAYKDFRFTLSGGYYPDVFSGSVGFEYRRFITVQAIYEDLEHDDGDKIKVLIGIHFRPPVVVREIAVVETMTVKQPVIVEKTIIKKEPLPPPKTSGEPTAEQQAYCETHYMKGIELYVNDRIDAAIEEWNLVTKVDPDYKDVQRYLENAQAKKELLKEH